MSGSGEGTSESAAGATDATAMATSNESTRGRRREKERGGGAPPPPSSHPRGPPAAARWDLALEGVPARGGGGVTVRFCLLTFFK
jgi:hypothetical protein